MSKKDKHRSAKSKGSREIATASVATNEMTTEILSEEYHAELNALQIELVKLQRHFIGCGDRILVILEGRDSAGKDGCIKRIAAHLSPREHASSPLVSRRTEILRVGIFSVTFRIFRWRKSWYCSTAAGTTAPALST
jgi:polyphosphate kinase 2 (PPK2 family)